MKHDSYAFVLTGAILAFLTAWGAMGCLASAFDLTIRYPGWLLLIWGMTALVSSALLSFPQGGSILLCLMTFPAALIWYNGEAADQFLQLAHRLITIYNRAYHWNLSLPVVPSQDVFCPDWPLGILGVLIIIAVAQSVLRQSTIWLPMTATLLPLASCIVVTDTVPGELWLMMVLSCLILLLLTAGVRRENPAQGIRLMHMAALPVVLALAGLMLTSPPEDYVNHSNLLRDNVLIAAQNLPSLMETDPRQISSSLQGKPSRQVNLAALGPRIPFTYPVMEVTAEQSGSLYLRQQDYDCYDGLGWTASENREEDFFSISGQEETIVIHTKTRKNVRCLPYHPAAPATLVNGYADHPDQAQTYSVLRHRLPENWRQTVRQNTAASEQWPTCTALPEHTREDAAAFLEGLYSEQASNTEKAVLIAALVADTARYDLNPQKMPPVENDFALWFLRQGETGYCVHFATAATVLLRAADVPARYVTGYLLEAKAGEPVTVTEENAHAWAEYYEPNLGLWLPLEATPAADVPTSPPETTAPVESTPPSAAEEPSPSEADLPAAPTLSPPEESPAPEQNHPNILLLFLLPPGLLVLVLQRLLRLKLRQRRQHRGTPNQQALQRWREAERLSRLLKDHPTEELIHLAQRAKFSQHTLTEEDLLQFEIFNRSCLRRLRKKPWHLQLIYRYLYAAY